ncbi:UNVERIFIED_CONTAM: hypothetical protein Slati_2164900 [Sesamum latifolium]|uniref:Aminotransferase-like plant mobile domain-containing protein n=1 Tax=Sesamum latifolium TaxID=2727402 RepID=A0AAW2WV67_9LAMI
MHPSSVVETRCGKKLRLINTYDGVYASLFTYDQNSDIIKAFCEAWYPLTNTLLTSVGELSISLWDLHDLAGLPITGCLYDEVVRSALELTSADEKGGRFIPRSSKYLLYAYHLLQGADDDRCSNVSIDKWVKFWSKKAIKYHLPLPRKEKKTVRPKSTHNPLGDIATHKRWSTAEEALFGKLCIEGNLKEEVYLAAYLACWLCTFILPGKDVNSIRPSTFKMASMMASGQRVSLVILVLMSIYECLNTIATSSRSARTSPYFPIHFVYAWLASYFKTHYPVWQGLHGPKMIRFSSEGGAKPFQFVDNGDAEELKHNYFVAIRSSYLTLRQGDKFIIEPYNPHRFGRQFRYFQDVPGTLKYDTRATSLEEGLHYWRLCVLSKSSSKAWLPAQSHLRLHSNVKKHEDKQVDGGEDNPSHALAPSIVIKCNPQAIVAEASKGKEASASRSPSADFIVQLEDEIQSIDASEESETSHSWTTTPLGMRLKGKQLSRPPAVSVFEVDFLSSIKDDDYLILESMKSFQKFDITKVEESLNTKLMIDFKMFKLKANEGASKVQSIMDKLEHIEKEIVVLKGRRTSLCAALKGQKQLNHDVQVKVHEVEKDIAALENTAPLDDAMVEDLESSKK